MVELNPLTEFDPGLLERLVCQVTGASDARCLDWTAEIVSGGVQANTVVYRLRGQAKVNGEARPWSLILKKLHTLDQSMPVLSGETLPPFNDWRNEGRVYQSGLLEDLPPGLRAPRCYQVIEEAGQSYSIFLEDIPIGPGQYQAGSTWEIEQYRQAALNLGRFHGAYLVGKPLPQVSWMRDDFLRRYLQHAAPNIPILMLSLNHPVLKNVLRDAPVDFISQTWEERDAVLLALSRLPHTFAHQDFFCRNLYSMPSQAGLEILAVDWSYAGLAPLGADLAALICASLTFTPKLFQQIQPEGLERLALEGYLEGLTQAGVQVDGKLEQSIRFSYAATVFYRFFFGALVGEALPLILDESSWPFAEQIFGSPVEVFFECLAVIVGYLQKTYQAARKSLRLQVGD